MKRMMLLVVLVALLLPVAASAESVFLPSVQNGPRDWFTVSDVLKWIDETGNVMPVYCYGPMPDIYTSCTVVQAQPLTLVWDAVAGKVVAQ